MSHHVPHQLPGAKEAVWTLTGTCGAGALAMIGAPWWARVICVVAGLAYGSLQAVFPQCSADRLAWWTDRRRYMMQRERRREATLPPRELTTEPGGGTRPKSISSDASVPEHDLNRRAA